MTCTRLRPRYGFLFALTVVIASGCSKGEPTSTRRSRPSHPSAAHASVSKIYTLRVERPIKGESTMANYCLMRRGELVWSAERPYEFVDVTITDQGWVVGVAESRKVAGSFTERYLHLLILDAQGTEILNDTMLRQKGLHTRPPLPPIPFARQMIVDEPNDYVLYRMVEFDADSPVRRSPVWLFHRISDGRRIRWFNPYRHLDLESREERVINVETIPGTPLLAVHATTRGPDTSVNSRGACFLIIKSDGTVVGQLDVEGDYTGIVFDRNSPRDGALEYFRRTPALLLGRGPGQIGIRLFATNEHVTFAVQLRKKSWQVEEIDRKPFSKPLPPNPTDISHVIMKPPA